MSKGQTSPKGRSGKRPKSAKSRTPASKTDPRKDADDLRALVSSGLENGAKAAAEVGRLARREPLLFAGGAALAGFLIGRMVTAPRARSQGEDPGRPA